MTNTSSSGSEEIPLVLQDLRGFLKRDGPSSLFDKSVMATPVAAIKALLGVVQRSKATTMMGLQDELKQAKEIMIKDIIKNEAESRGRSLIALASGCDLFLKYVTRSFLETPDFEACRQEVLERGEIFAGISLAARDRIAHVAADFIQEGQTVLTHGWSRVVASILLKAAETKHFDIIVLEGRPDAAGARAAKFYATHSSSIPTTIVLDSAMGYVMEKVDIVLVGAEAVVENGGCVNKMGTYSLATCAKAHGKPFYVASESYKFARLYPLNQKDLPNMGNVPLECFDTTSYSLSQCADPTKDGEPEEAGRIGLPDNIKVDNPPCDFTPAKFITLLFTDLGVLTPSAVSDELIRLYQ